MVGGAGGVAEVLDLPRALVQVGGARRSDVGARRIYLKMSRLFALLVLIAVLPKGCVSLYSY